MAEQAEVPSTVTPEQFFAELLPAGYQAQKEQGIGVPQNFTMQYEITGDGGGSWHVAIASGEMAVKKGREDANLTMTISYGNWQDAVLSRNGADIALLLPQGRPGRPDTSDRAKMVKGTMALELAREGDPFTMEVCFSGAAAPRTVMKAKIEDYIAIGQGKLNGQEAFMTGRVRVDGDMAFMMQIAALTA
jgi:putative sterol carrier protein